jgi:Ca-activated chloride channel family protein
MSGSKLNLCKKTCEILIHELKSTDMFGLVSFSDEAKLVLSLCPMTQVNKDRALAYLNGLQSQGCTNISGGSTLGIAELQKSGVTNSSNATTVQSLMLLTDGNANRGISGTIPLITLARGCLSASPYLSVYTFGYGSDHNDELLKGLSEANSENKGTDYFIDKDDDVSSAFGDCLGGLLSVTAQNLKIKIEGSNIVVKHSSAKLVPVDERINPAPGTSEWTVSLGDMFAEESKDIIVEVTPLPTSEGLHTITCSMSYVDVLSARQISSTPVLGSTSIVSGSSVSNGNKHVLFQVTRVDVVDTMANAKRLADSGELGEARKLIAERLAAIDAMVGTLTITAEERITIANFKSDLNEALSGLTSINEYRAYGSKGMTSKMQSHAYQRSNAVNEDEQNLYRGSSKMGMARKMKGFM